MLCTLTLKERKNGRMRKYNFNTEGDRLLMVRLDGVLLHSNPKQIAKDVVIVTGRKENNSLYYYKHYIPICADTMGRTETTELCHENSVQPWELEMPNRLYELHLGEIDDVSEMEKDINEDTKLYLNGKFFGMTGDERKVEEWEK